MEEEEEKGVAPAPPTTTRAASGEDGEAMPSLLATSSVAVSYTEDELAGLFRNEGRGLVPLSSAFFVGVTVVGGVATVDDGVAWGFALEAVTWDLLRRGGVCRWWWWW